MTTEHSFKLLIPRLTWFTKAKLEFIRQWRRLKTTAKIIEKGNGLRTTMLELQRKNTTESIHQAYGIQKQLEILLWVIKKEG